MATAGELALPAGAMGRPVHARFGRLRTIAASGPLRRNADPAAPLLRLPPPSRFAATRSSLAAVPVGRRPSLFGRGSSGAESGAHQVRGGRGSPNAIGNATGRGCWSSGAVAGAYQMRGGHGLPNVTANASGRGWGSSGAVARAYQMHGGRVIPNVTANASGRGDGAPALDEDEKVRVAKIMALFLRIHEREIRKLLWIAKVKNMLGSLLVLGICLWIGHLAVKGNEHAVLFVAVCDKGDKVYKLALAIKAILWG